MYMRLVTAGLAALCARTVLEAAAAVPVPTPVPLAAEVRAAVLGAAVFRTTEPAVPAVPAVPESVVFRNGAVEVVVLATSAFERQSA